MRRMSKFDGTNVTFVRHNYPIRITKITLGKAGGSLAPAYDLKPVPTDLKARVLSTNIDLDEGTCSLDLLQAASELFKAVGARSAEINRMASAFEHDDLTRALSRVGWAKALFAPCPPCQPRIHGGHTINPRVRAARWLCPPYDRCGQIREPSVSVGTLDWDARRSHA